MHILAIGEEHGTQMSAHFEVNEGVAHPAPLEAKDTDQDADQCDDLNYDSTDVFRLVQNGLVVVPDAVLDLLI